MWAPLSSGRTREPPDELLKPSTARAPAEPTAVSRGRLWSAPAGASGQLSAQLQRVYGPSSSAPYIQCSSYLLWHLHLARGASGGKSSDSLPLREPHTTQVLNARGQADSLDLSLPTPKSRPFRSERTSHRPLQSFGTKPKNPLPSHLPLQSTPPPPVSSLPSLRHTLCSDLPSPGLNQYSVSSGVFLHLSMLPAAATGIFLEHNSGHVSPALKNPSLNIH